MLELETYRAKRPLLLCGIAVAPLFYILVGLQLGFRPNFPIRSLPVSYLALGDYGWVQSTNFILTGVLALAFAYGVRGVLRGGSGYAAGPILIALYGVGMIGAGLFIADPAPAPGTKPEMSPIGALHMVSFLLAILSLIIACFVLAHRLWSEGRKGWAGYSFASGAIAPSLVAASMAAPAWAGLIVGGAGLILFGWLSLVARELAQSTR